jgi:hypothetical protein
MVRVRYRTELIRPELIRLASRGRACTRGLEVLEPGRPSRSKGTEMWV